MNGKRKGSAFEREIAKKISIWLSGKPDTVWRTSNSGGKSSITNSKIQSGDLQSVSEESKLFFDKFSVELKNYKELDLWGFQNKNFKLYDWWEQAKSDAKRANKIPLLIIRINRKGDWLIFDKEVSAKLFDLHILEITDLSASEHINILKINENILSGLYIYPFDFLMNFRIK